LVSEREVVDLGAEGVVKAAAEARRVERTASFMVINLIKYYYVTRINPIKLDSRACRLD